MPTRTATVTTVGIFSRIVIRLLMVGQFILTEARNQSDLGNRTEQLRIRNSGARRFVGKPIDEITSAHPGSLSRRMWASLCGNATPAQRDLTPLP